MAEKPAFYDCGICGSHHPLRFDGDCRDDANRFAAGELDEKYNGEWIDVPMDEVEEWRANTNGVS